MSSLSFRNPYEATQYRMVKVSLELGEHQSRVLDVPHLPSDSPGYIKVFMGNLPMDDKKHTTDDEIVALVSYFTGGNGGSIVAILRHLNQLGHPQTFKGSVIVQLPEEHGRALIANITRVKPFFTADGLFHLPEGCSMTYAEFREAYRYSKLFWGVPTWNSVTAEVSTAKGRHQAAQHHHHLSSHHQPATYATPQQHPMCQQHQRHYHGHQPQQQLYQQTPTYYQQHQYQAPLYQQPYGGLPPQNFSLMPQYQQAAPYGRRPQQQQQQQHYHGHQHQQQLYQQAPAYYQHQYQLSLYHRQHHHHRDGSCDLAPPLHDAGDSYRFSSTRMWNGCPPIVAPATHRQMPTPTHQPHVPQFDADQFEGLQ